MIPGTLADFFRAGVAVVVTFILARLTRIIVRRLLLRFSHMTVAGATAIARASASVIWAFGIVFAVAILGIDLGPAVMLILVVTIVVFFAGRGLMANFSAGLILQGSPMFTPGDEVATAAGTGNVREITGRTVVVVRRTGVRSISRTGTSSTVPSRT
jgi:small-conductance mechanosensitive channel